MKNCNKELAQYYDDKVKLPQDTRNQLATRRDANRDRVKDGLKRDGKPAPEGFVTQGSYAMGTTIQEPGNSYDIDDGVIFVGKELVGPNGGEVTALDARQMVRDAVDDGAFKNKPEIKTNCVRVSYNDGPHVDIPVYRRKADGTKELASAEWKVSDPDGVNEWFKRCLASKVGADAAEQMRTIIRLLKAFCVNRGSYSLPSGFVLTVLVNDAYFTYDERLDCALRQVMQSVYNRLLGSLTVRHPVVAEDLAASDDPKPRQLRDLLKTALEDLRILDRSNCRHSDALKAWKKVFNTAYFDSAINEAEAAEKSQAAAAAASFTHVPKPWCP